MSAHWPIRQLGEIFEIARGGSPRPIENFITDRDDGLNWIKISDATSSGKYIKKTKEKIKPEGVSKTRVVSPGDFLLTNSMSFGRPYIVATHGCIHDGWLVLRPTDKSKVDEGYFYHLLGSDAIYLKLASRASGSTVKNLNTDIVSSLEVPLPPLDEQRRIAAILDKADALRQKRKRALDLLDGLTQSRFATEFSSELRVAPLGDVLDDIDSGWSPSCLDRAAHDDEFGILKLSAITQGSFEASENKALPMMIPPRHRDEVSQGDILLCRKNTRELVGASVYVWETRPKVFISDLIFRLIPKLNIVEPIYLQAAISAFKARQKIAALSAGSAGSMPNISKAKLREVSIPMPSMSRQQHFSEFVRAINLQRKHHVASLIAMDMQFISLQHRAFSGQI